MTWFAFKNVHVYNIFLFSCYFYVSFANGFVLLILETYRAFGGDAPFLTCTNELIESSELLILLQWDIYVYSNH